MACLAVEEGVTNATAVSQVAFALSPDKLLEKDGVGRGESYAASTVRRALAKAKPRATGADFFEGMSADATANLPAPPEMYRVVCGLIDPKRLPVRCWLVRPRLPIGDVCQLVGAPGVSKSTFTLRDALAVATGREDLLRGVDGHGNPITAERLHKTGSVIVYNAEDRLDEMERRLAASMRHFGVTAGEMAHDIILWFGVDHTPIKIMTRDHERRPLQPAKELALLEGAIRKHNVALVILDPQASLSRGELRAIVRPDVLRWPVLHEQVGQAVQHVVRPQSSRHHDRQAQAIQNGLIGRPVTATVMYNQLKSAGYFDLEWRRKVGGGPILINLIHEIDLIRFMFGEIHSLQAVSSNAVRGFAVEDIHQLRMWPTSLTLSSMQALETGWRSTRRRRSPYRRSLLGETTLLPSRRRHWIPARL